MDPSWRPERTVSCPYCGEPFLLVVDTDGGEADDVEDCPVCCAPIEVAVAVAITRAVRRRGVLPGAAPRRRPT